MAHSRVQRALDDIGAGRMVIVVDDEDRENEGDLCMAADAVTPGDINFMVTHGRGLVCLPMTQARLAQLELPMMVQRNTSSFGTGFTVSIEARRGVTTGISAADRAHTIRTAVHPDTTAEDLARPGHIFPLCARPGGVLERIGQTEASVDLARLAGRAPAAVICEILNDDGTMARRPALERFAAQHGLCIVSVAELVAYRQQHDPQRPAAAAFEAPNVREDKNMTTWPGLQDNRGAWRPTGGKIAIVAARFNEQIVERLVTGAYETFKRLGGEPAALSLTWVPGAFELPIVAQRIAQAQQPSAVIALGAIVRGDTPHFDYVAGQAAAGCMQVGLKTGVPIIFGVLTCDTTDQALARAGLKAGNKGSDAMLAAVETAQVLVSASAAR